MENWLYSFYSLKFLSYGHTMPVKHNGIYLCEFSSNISIDLATVLYSYGTHIFQRIYDDLCRIIAWVSSLIEWNDKCIEA